MPKSVTTGVGLLHLGQIKGLDPSPSVLLSEVAPAGTKLSFKRYDDLATRNSENIIKPRTDRDKCELTVISTELTTESVVDVMERFHTESGSSIDNNTVVAVCPKSVKGEVGCIGGVCLGFVTKAGGMRRVIGAATEEGT